VVQGPEDGPPALRYAVFRILRGGRHYP
jgi:hypothetical protein